MNSQIIYLYSIITMCPLLIWHHIIIEQREYMKEIYEGNIWRKFVGSRLILF